MRRLISLLLLLCVAALAAPQRIVSTAPSLTEILYALGLGPRVVGVTIYCRYPKDAISKPKVGTFLQPDLERILSLKPDLVLVVKNPVQLTAQLGRLGLKAEELNQDSVQDILTSIEKIGALTGAQAEAARLVASLRADIDAVRKAVAGKPKRSAIFLVGRSPGTLQGMVGAGPHTFIDELLTIAGGSNAMADSPIQYPKISLEQILTRDPEFILDMGDFAHAEGRPGQPEAEIRALWGKYPRLRAVQKNQVVVIGSETFIRPGPRMTQGLRQFQEILHPETRR